MMDKVAFFADYLAKKPGDRFAMYSLALELAKTERWNDAEQAFGSLLEVHPQSGAGHYQLGMLLSAQEKHEAALAAWRQGLALLKGSSESEARRSIVEIEAAIEDLLDDM